MQIDFGNIYQICVTTITYNFACMYTYWYFVRQERNRKQTYLQRHISSFIMKWMIIFQAVNAWTIMFCGIVGSVKRSPKEK